jgi:hypothetical protein
MRVPYFGILHLEAALFKNEESAINVPGGEIRFIDCDSATTLVIVADGAFRPGANGASSHRHRWLPQAAVCILYAVLIDSAQTRRP